MPTVYVLRRRLRDDTHLPEESLAASAGRRRVVDVDIVVLCAHRLLHKRLLEDFSVHLHVVLALHQVTLWEAKTETGHRESVSARAPAAASRFGSTSSNDVHAAFT